MGTSRWAFASLAVCMLMPSLDTSIANVGLPTLAAAFGASFQQVQWIVLAYLLAITSLIVGAGRLGDIVGRRRMLLVGLGLFTATSVLCSMAPTIWILILARAAQGIGAAIMMALTVALSSDMVPRAKTGSVMGLLGTMSAIGTTLGPSLGGVLIATFGWRMIFLINVPIGVLSFLLALRTLPRDQSVPRTDRASFDVIGTMLLALTLTAYALSVTIQHGRFSDGNVALLSIAVLGAGAFVYAQTRVGSPLIPLGMFRDTTVRAGLAMNVLVSTVMMATLVVGPFYLSIALGLDAKRVGLVMSAGPLMATLAGIPAGRVVDRYGTQRTTMVALIGLSCGLLALSVAPGQFGVIGYVTSIVIVTAHYALFQAANNTGVMTGVAPAQRGVVSGVLGLSRNLGLITGASVMGAVFAFASSTRDISSAPPAAVAAGMRATFMVAAAIVFAALGIASASRARASRLSLSVGSASVLVLSALAPAAERQHPLRADAIAIGHGLPHTGRHDSSVRHLGSLRRGVNRLQSFTRGPRDEALQPRVAARSRVATEVARAPS